MLRVGSIHSGVMHGTFFVATKPSPAFHRVFFSSTNSSKKSTMKNERRFEVVRTYPKGRNLEMTGKPLISFDYAIKYLLKDKGDYEIVEGFISALLKSYGYKDVKIIALLDTESNKFADSFDIESSISKRSLADVIVQDEERRKYIIEIERTVNDSFIHKACFNTSRLIVDHLAERMDYKDIVKVFHISLLYFPMGDGAIHHEQTIIRELESKKRLTLHIKNPETGETIDAADILPEYFFISVPLFNGRLEKEMDDWLYVLKYDNIPEKFHSPYMQKVADKLNLLKMTQEERERYNYYLKKLYNDRDELQAAEAKGIAKGKEIGIAKGRKNLARKMLEKGIDVETISELTGGSLMMKFGPSCNFGMTQT